MNYVFLGLNEEWINCAKEKGYDTYLGKVEEFVHDEKYEKVFYLSCANSLLFMDGGIDLAYSTVMFPGIEKKIKRRLNSEGKISKVGKMYLPIGKAFVTKCNKRDYLVSSPTMLLPQDVSKTRNAYYSMVAVFNELNRKNLICSGNLLVIPAMCCGWGKMDATKSIKQIYKAIDKCKNKKRFKIDYKKVIDQQPNYYCNSEWKDIKPEDIEKII
jgi:O-acetyl-ADP-ribose deacetylase (regulator of RNase III)